MRVEYVTPFAESAIKIFESTVTGDIKQGPPSLAPQMSSILGTAVIIGLAGQVSGRVLIDMTQDTALKIASIMNEEEMTEFDEMVSATLTELGNMITGTAVTKLHDMGFKFDITPPALFWGDNIKLTDLRMESLVVPITLPVGEVKINVALKEQ